MKKLTTKEFIDRCKKIHKDYYDYSLVYYKNIRTKIKIICPVHGEFEVLPKVHLRGSKCKLCINNNIRSNEKIFIEKSKKIHGDTYDYSLIEYINNFTKMKIICKKHGIFEQTSNSHLRGDGCIKCAGLEKMTKEIFIEKSKKIHGDIYDYSLVNYINNKTKIKIICEKHGIFEQKPNNHTIQKQGCPDCSGLKKLTIEQFIIRSNKIHNNFYDYSLASYVNNNTKVRIICPKHGIFEQTPNLHIRSGCPHCRESKGERIIRNFLLNHEITFEKNKKFKNCKYKRVLRFDFYLKNYNLLIEFDGVQHSKLVKYWGGEETYENVKNRDNIKNDFCEKNKIKLIRINNLKLINTILKKELQLNG